MMRGASVVVLLAIVACAPVTAQQMNAGSAAYMNGGHPYTGAMIDQYRSARHDREEKTAYLRQQRDEQIAAEQRIAGERRLAAERRAADIRRAEEAQRQAEREAELRLAAEARDIQIREESRRRAEAEAEAARLAERQITDPAYRCGQRMSLWQCANILINEDPSQYRMTREEVLSWLESQGIWFQYERDINECSAVEPPADFVDRANSVNIPVGYTTRGPADRPSEVTITAGGATLHTRFRRLSDCQAQITRRNPAPSGLR